MIRFISVLILLGLGPWVTKAQEVRLPHQILVKLMPGVEVQGWLNSAKASGDLPAALRLERTLVPAMNIHQLICHDPGYPDARLLEQVKALPDVQLAQFNHQVARRAPLSTFPNDPSFVSQWNLHNTGQAGGTADADIDAPEAWDLATGGLTVHGDTLVIAIIDEGIDTAHPEMKFWHNRAEIPGNGRDDDRNGYVDDFQGWNAYQSNGLLPATRHGTHVAGIAGARGDNAIGVAGVNWDVQLMNVAGSSGNEATVIEAYGYVIAQRRRYDQSNGAEGAFVVATNSSFGVNNGDPANFPIWCALYDTLGRLGILNAVSTANSAVDVDVVGDMPSTCPSDYMVAVTMTNNLDQLDGTAAWGPVNIDLGAPGRQILSTFNGGGVGTLSGTSMSAPHIAGASSLMLAAAGNEFMSLYKNFPDSAVLILKSLMLASVDTLPSLLGKSVSGGRLNLYKALLALQAYNDSMADCALPYSLAASQRTDSAVLLKWEGSGSAYLLQHREAGSLSWQDVQLSQPPYFLQGLQACKEYEFRVASICGADSSGFSAILRFRSEGCCEAPDWMELIAVTDSSALLVWPSVYAAEEYRMEYRQTGAVAWNVQATPDTFLLLAGLQTCTRYELRLAARCDTGLSSFGDTLSFTSLGCGFCIEGNYCLSQASNADDDWIAGVTIDTLVNLSGSDDGYGDFTYLSIPLLRNEPYNLKLEPGFAGLPFIEYWRVWMDYNRDGDFAHPEELLFDAGMTSDTTVNGQFVVPDTVAPGPVRIRVSMRFSQPALPCSNFDFGEVEDYCAEILGPSTGLDPEMGVSVRLFPNPAMGGQVHLESSVPLREVAFFNMLGQGVFQAAIGGKKQTLEPILVPGLYLVRIRTASGMLWKKVRWQP